MLDIISMIITMIVLGYIIAGAIKNRKQWINYLIKIGKDKKQKKKKLPESIFVVLLVCIAIISLVISAEVSKRFFLTNSALKIVSSIIIWEIVSVLLVLLITCIFIIIKEIRKVNDRMVNGILLYSIVIIIFQLIQLQQKQLESVECSLLIDGVAYIFNMICIFHITGKTFEKEVFVKNVWSTMMINMTFIIIELSSMVYQVQKMSEVSCFNQPIELFTDCIYYVLISFFTVGYGDLYPVDIKAKAISLLIVITGFLFTAVFFGIAMTVTTDKIQQKTDRKL